MKQNALTLISPVEEQNVEKLREVLKTRQQDFKDALGKLGTIHYARWVIIDSETIKNEVLPTQLVFSSNFDGDVDTHIRDIVNKVGDLLDVIYENTVGYTPQAKLEFLTLSRIKEASFYQGSPGRTLKVIADEKALHQEIFNHIQAGNWDGMSAKQVHEVLKKNILANPAFAWAKQNIETPGINIPGLILSGIVLIALLPVIIIWAIIIQVFFENFDKPLGLTPNELNPAHLQEMEKDEDFFYQNQFSQVINMKPGRMRLITVNGFYLFSRVLIGQLFVKGKLMGIPTIHFARWVQINDKKRMLFFSNFDGSWTQYLGDFIDKSGWGLTGIFSNTQGFPKALLLIMKGAYNERQFLAWARYTQIKTQLWYAADVSQSIKNINNNTIVRNAFPKNLSEKEAKLFLAKI
jgi:hypothetical protein